MSNTIDDKELDDYLSGDTQYSRRYRAMAADAVPPELDSLVLANATADNVVAISAAPARANVTRRSKSLGFWLRVSTPVALAASFVLVFSIMMESGVRHDAAPATKLDESESPKLNAITETVAIEQPVASPMSLDVAVEKTKEATARRDQDARARIAEPITESISPAVAFAPAEEAKKESRAPASAPVASAPAPARAQANKATATELEQIIVTGNYVRGSAEDAALAVDVISSEDLNKASAGNAAGPRSTIPQSSFLKRAPSDVELIQLQRESDPTEWLIYIRDLRTNNKASEADAEWLRFVKAYPNYVVDAADTARPKK